MPARRSTGKSGKAISFPASSSHGGEAVRLKERVQYCEEREEGTRRDESLQPALLHPHRREVLGGLGLSELRELRHHLQYKKIMNKKRTRKANQGSNWRGRTRRQAAIRRIAPERTPPPPAPPPWPPAPGVPSRVGWRPPCLCGGPNAGTEKYILR